MTKKLGFATVFDIDTYFVFNLQKYLQLQLKLTIWVCPASSSALDDARRIASGSEESLVSVLASYPVLLNWLVL